MNGRCCIFQPFDDGPFDKRYVDVLEPAVRASDLEPYRVDKDPGASIPIETLHSEIRSCAACLADITTDNPNVWYELGFAIATAKPIVMICSEERGKRFPFDIQHRAVIRYKVESPSDFEKLEREITTRLKAELRTQADVAKVVAASPLKNTQGLAAHESAILALLLANRVSSLSGTSLYVLKQNMKEALFSEAAAVLATISLTRKGLIESFDDREYDGSLFEAWRLTRKGEDWLLENQETLELRIQGS